MVEQKAAVAMMEIEQSELDRVSEAFGYHLISTSRLTGGYASSNFAAVLKPPGGAAEFTAVLKFSYAAMPREEIEHQLTVLRALEQHGFATNYLLPKLAAAPDAGEGRTVDVPRTAYRGTTTHHHTRSHTHRPCSSARATAAGSSSSTPPAQPTTQPTTQLRPAPACLPGLCDRYLPIYLSLSGLCGRYLSIYLSL